MRIGVLEPGTNHWPTLQRHAETVSVALADLGPGVYRRVAFPRPQLVRLPPPERRESDQSAAALIFLDECRNTPISRASRPAHPPPSPPARLAAPAAD